MKRLSTMISPRMRQAAVTLTELLVVLVIISVLSTVALPVYVNQAERARVSTAQYEVAELAKAEEQCGIEHGRFVPLQVLDDLPGSNGSTQSSRADTISEESQTFAIDYNVPYSLLNSGNANFQISSSSPDRNTATMVEKWQGPFINFQRYYIPPTQNTQTANYADFPLDPWGNPYLLYSPIGLVGSYSPTVGGQLTVSQFNGILSTTDPRFDRWAIVSYGPDGVSFTNGGNVDDDIVYTFAYVRAETIF